MHRLFKIEVDEPAYKIGSAYYEYGEDELDAVTAVLTKNIGLDVKVKEVKPVNKADLIDAARGVQK